MLHYYLTSWTGDRERFGRSGGLRLDDEMRQNKQAPGKGAQQLARPGISQISGVCP